MTRYERLQQCVADSDIAYFNIDSEKQPAKAICIERDCAIFFNESAFETNADRFVALAHEKGHCDTGMFYSIHTPLMTKGICEYRAWKRALLDHLPFDALMDAFEACRTADGVTVYDVSQYLGVTEDFAFRAIEIYAQVGKKIM